MLNDDLRKLVKRLRHCTCTDPDHDECAMRRSAATALERLLAENAALREDQKRLLRIGKHLPRMLDAMQWGSLTGAFLEDGDIRAAIDAARREGKP